MGVVMVVVVWAVPVGNAKALGRGVWAQKPKNQPTRASVWGHAVKNSSGGRWGEAVGWVWMR